MTGAPLIDRAVIDELIDSIGHAGTRSVLALFIDESGAYIAAISEGAAPGADAARRDRARRAAHSLKSGAAQIGATALAAAAAAVETAAENNAADLADTAAALDRSAADTVAGLTQFLAG